MLIKFAKLKGENIALVLGQMQLNHKIIVVNYSKEGILIFDIEDLIMSKLLNNQFEYKNIRVEY